MAGLMMPRRASGGTWAPTPLAWGVPHVRRMVGRFNGRLVGWMQTSLLRGNNPRGDIRSGEPPQSRPGMTGFGIVAEA